MVWIAVGVVVIVAVAAFLLSGGKKKEEVNFKTEKVAKVNILNSITATGTIEPVNEVTVGTQVSGIVSKLYVDYNSVVKKGQVIAELDKSNLMSQLNTAKAQLSQAQASLRSAQSDLAYQKANYNRYKTLYQKGLISANDYETARLSYQTSQQTVVSRKDQVVSAQEEVSRAQTNLSYATITSPIDGIVVSKSVEEGQTVNANMSTPDLFTIAQDLTNMQVVADVDEADIGGVEEGQRATFTVDAYPNDVFEGTVIQVRLGESSSSSSSASGSSTVVTYEVIISAPNPSLKLKPRLTANVTIYTLDRQGVLAVPTRALRFTPDALLVGDKAVVNDVQAEHKVWTRQGNTFTAHAVETGISGGNLTEIVNGIAEGTEIITEATLDAAAGGMPGAPQAEAGGERSPFMPSPPGSKKK